MRLYSGPLSMFGAKVEIAALEKGLPVKVFMVPYDPQRGYEPKHPDIVRVNPKRQVPVLIDGDLEIFDSDPKARASARLLEHRADEVYFPHIIALMSLQATPEDPVAVAARAAAVFYREMEAVLGDRQFLGGALSYADIGFFMASLFGERMGAVMGRKTPRLLAWREAMAARPSVRQVAGAMMDYLASIGRPVPEFMTAAAAG